MVTQMEKTVYQTDRAGLYTGTTTADASPLEEGVWLLPAGSVETPPPQHWPEQQWPRWNGRDWELITRPAVTIAPSPAEKLAAFLASNPDVVSLIERE